MNKQNTECLPIDTKAIWGIDAENLRDISAPYSKSRTLIIGDRYLVKEEFCPLQIHNIANVMQILQTHGIALPVQVGKIHKQDGKLYRLYKMHQPIKDLTPDLLVQAAQQISLISSIDKDELRAAGIGHSFIAGSLAVEKAYIMKRAAGNLKVAYERASTHLESKLFPLLPFFNKEPCHGDLHPNNLLQEERKLLIADWETLTISEEMTDIAMLLGCIGINEPTDMIGEKGEALLSTFAADGKPSKLAYMLLPELVLASRLRWLHKWLAIGDDPEMIRMECSLISMILDNNDALRKRWALYAHTDFKYSKHKWFLQDAGQMDEVNKAMERLKRPYPDYLHGTIQKAADLRQSMIYYGQNDDIVNVLKQLNELQALAEESKSEPVLIEYSIALGNSCLDLSKFGLMDALQHNRTKLKEISDDHPEIPDLFIGQAFSIRNLSIVLAEKGNLPRAMQAVDELGAIAGQCDEIEIKGEYARALSNMITSLLAAKGTQVGHFTKDEAKQKMDDLLRRLKFLHEKYPLSKKIDAAHKIAVKNIGL